MSTSSQSPAGFAAPMFPRYHAQTRPDVAAIIMGRTGHVTTFLDLERRANQIANGLYEEGARLGDSVAILMENRPELLEITWGAQRLGLRYTVINHHLLTAEVQYILDDCEAKAVFTTAALAEVVAGLDLGRIETRLSIDATLPGWRRFEDWVAELPIRPAPHEAEGTEMLYSSGTTGRPKGVHKPLPATPLGDPAARPVSMAAVSRERYGIGPGDVYLVPAPLYHAAPLVAAMSSHRNGATVVVMERFDPELCLSLIEHHRVTHAQFVPTMFIRMLATPEAQRQRYDLSSLKVAIHAAAPCPIEVKERLIEWWGPIVYEYYSGTEDIGGTGLTSEEWLLHKGSVGRPQPGITIHILGPDGEELPPGVPGQIFLDGGRPFEYHNDPDKTASIVGPHGWRTLGDIGYVDDDGYLYLTDRQSHMIVAGGVNIYPQEAENVLATHPDVIDVAVIGVPNPEYGEEVKAVVQLRDQERAGPEMAAVLIGYCRERLARFKCPRSVDFVEEMPRDPNGKLYKRRLREKYWVDRTTSIV